MDNKPHRTWEDLKKDPNTIAGFHTTKSMITVVDLVCNKVSETILHREHKQSSIKNRKGD